MTLRVGDVFYAHLSTVPSRNNKYFVVVCCDDPVRLVLINTKNRVTVLGNPALGPTQVLVRQSELACLSYDSWIGCDQLFSGYTSEELVQLAASGAKCGELSLHLLERVLTAITASPTLVERQKLRCIEAIEAALSQLRQ